MLAYLYCMCSVLPTRRLVKPHTSIILHKSGNDLYDRFFKLSFKIKEPGGIPLYKPCRYVTPHRVGFLRLFCLKTGIHFAHFGLELAMVFKGTKECMNIFIVSIPNE